MLSLFYLALGAVLVLVLYRALRSSRWRSSRWARRLLKGGREQSVAALRKELRRLAHDPDVVERLLDAERDRSPELGEAALLAKVIRRLRRDRGR